MKTILEFHEKYPNCYLPKTCPDPNMILKVGDIIVLDIVRSKEGTYGSLDATYNLEALSGKPIEISEVCKSLSKNIYYKIKGDNSNSIVFWYHIAYVLNHYIPIYKKDNYLKNI